MSIEDDLIRDEDDRLLPYDDATGKEFHPGMTLVGNLTISTGINLSAGITSEESAYLRKQRIARAESELRKTFTWFLSAPESVQRGLTNMVFNMGLGRLLGFQNMLKALAAKDYKEAAVEALDSKWAAQVGDRAKRIAELFLSAKGE